MPPKIGRGIVIKEKPLNDSDKLLTIFSENGKFTAVANNVRRPRSKLAAGTRLFSWSQFTYFPGKNLARITEAELIEPFYDLSLDLEKINYASYSMDLVDKFYDEEQTDKKLLKLLVYYLHYLNKKESSYLLLTLAFQIKLLVLAGISPDFKSINGLDKNRNIYFSINDGIFTDKYVSDPNYYQYKLNSKQLERLIKLYKNPFNTFKDIILEDEELEEMEQLFSMINHFIEYNLTFPLRSFRVIKELKELNKTLTDSLKKKD